MAKGRRFENNVAGEIAELTDDSVNVWPCGYSGSNRYPCPDIAITTSGTLHGIELKKWTPDRRASGDGWEPRYVNKEEIEQLLAVANQYTKVHLGINFGHREMALFTAQVPTWDLDSIEDHFPDVEESPIATFDYGGEGIRFDKPSADEWPSAQSGVSAAEKIIDELLNGGGG